MMKEDFTHQLAQAQPYFIGEENAFRAAVLIPLVKINQEWHVLFQVRAFSMRKQPGDISFPGGHIDDTDESPKVAAIREAHEELGIAMNDVEVIGNLSPFITSPSFVIYPFVGILHDYPLPNYNKDEVEELFTVPLEWLLSHEPYMHEVDIAPTPNEDFPFHKIANGQKYKWRTRTVEEWFYEYEHYTIWGATARILKYFIELLQVRDIPVRQ